MDKCRTTLPKQVVKIATYVLLVVVFLLLRRPILRLAVVLIFAALTAVASFALAHGITPEAVPSE
jgi:hypothetical protein